MSEKELFRLLCCGLLHAALEAVHTASTQVFLLLTRIDWMAVAAGFDGLLLHSGRNLVDGAAVCAGHLSVRIDGWVDSGLHSGEIVRIIGHDARGVKGFG